MRSAFALISLLLLFGCFGQPQGYGSAKIELPDGAVMDCEVPRGLQEMELGLMYRSGLCRGCGMLFVFPEDGRHGIWMKNMKFNIDILFIDGGWKVVGMAQDVEPCKEEPCTVYKPDSNARYVLELNANATREHDVSIGSWIKKIG